MKKECAYTRKSLRKYVSGHVFALQKIRIERHLKSCAICSSEHQALRMKGDTRRLLKDVTPPGGIVQQLKEGVSGLARLKKLLYRPLWLAAIAGVIILVYVNVVSRRGDPEIESLERSLPPATATAPAVASAPATTSPFIPAQPAPVVQPAPASSSPVPKPAPVAPAVEPLAITATAENEQVAMRHINEVMRGHGLLRKLYFSDTVKEISGSLTAHELMTFFNRIESAVKVNYNRRRFESFPAAQPIPFVMKLKSAPKTAVRPPAPAAPKVFVPAEPAAQHTPAPASAQTTTP
jgi:anti-sigma factor RsiW